MGIEDCDGLGTAKKEKRLKRNNEKDSPVLMAMNDDQLMVIYLEVRKRLNKLIDKEIEERKGEVQFLPDEYRRFRLKGMKPEEIHYDLCHIWR